MAGRVRDTGGPEAVGVVFDECGEGARVAGADGGRDQVIEFGVEAGPDGAGGHENGQEIDDLVGAGGGGAAGVGGHHVGGRESQGTSRGQAPAAGFGERAGGGRRGGVVAEGLGNGEGEQAEEFGVVIFKLLPALGFGLGGIGEVDGEGEVGEGAVADGGWLVSALEERDDGGAADFGG